MKKLILFLLLLPFFAGAQQTFVTAAPGTSFSPTWRVQTAAADSLVPIWLGNGGNKFYWIYSATLSNLRFKRIADSTTATGYQTVGNFFPKADTRYYTQTYANANFINTGSGAQVKSGNILFGGNLGLTGGVATFQHIGGQVQIDGDVFTNGENNKLIFGTGNTHKLQLLSKSNLELISSHNYLGVARTITLMGDSARRNSDGALVVWTTDLAAYAPITGGSGYIQNQNSAAQTSSNYWISGAGRADGGFLIDRADYLGSYTVNNSSTTLKAQLGANALTMQNLTAGSYSLLAYNQLSFLLNPGVTSATIVPGTPTANRTLTMPDNSGTIQLTTDSTFTHNIDAASFSANKTDGRGVFQGRAQTATPATPASGYGKIYFDGSTRFSILGANGFAATLTKIALTATRIYSFPDFDGIFATTNNSQSFTATQTFTGGLRTSGNITNAYSSTIGANFDIGAATYTDNSSSGTVATNYPNFIHTPTLAAGSATNYTNTSTLTLDAEPIDGTNVTHGSRAVLRTLSGNVIFQGQGRLGIGLADGVSPSAMLHFNTASAFATSTTFSTAGFGIRFDNSTFQTSGTGGTVATAAYSYGIPTFSSLTNAYTLSTAASTYLAGPPTAGTNVTITTPYTLQVATGNSLFGGNIMVTGRIGAGASTAPSATIHSLATALNTGATFSGVNGFGLRIDAATYTSSGSSGTIALAGANTIAIPTFAHSTTSTTFTDAATLIIQGVPVAGTNATVTNGWALYATAGGIKINNGNLNLGTAGNKINITTGTNASLGTATLVAGTITVSTTAVTSSSKIFLTDATTGALTNIGTPTVGTIVNGTSFVINSSNILDTSSVNWFIIN